MVVACQLKTSLKAYLYCTLSVHVVSLKSYDYSLFNSAICSININYRLFALFRLVGILNSSSSIIILIRFVNSVSHPCSSDLAQCSLLLNR